MAAEKYVKAWSAKPSQTGLSHPGNWDNRNRAEHRTTMEIKARSMHLSTLVGSAEPLLENNSPSLRMMLCLMSLFM
jgi:hypothetical protein